MMSDNPYLGPWARIPGGKPITGNNHESCQSSVVAEEGGRLTFDKECVYDITNSIGDQIVGTFCAHVPIKGGGKGLLFKSGDDFVTIEEKDISSCRYIGIESLREYVDHKPASIVDDVIDDLKYRRDVGKRKYGREILSDVPCANGKSALENLYEELLDAVLYLKKALEEK